MYSITFFGKRIQVSGLAFVIYSSLLIVVSLIILVSVVNAISSYFGIGYILTTLLLFGIFASVTIDGKEYSLLRGHIRCIANCALLIATVIYYIK